MLCKIRGRKAPYLFGDTLCNFTALRLSQCRALTYTSSTMTLAKIRVMKPCCLFILLCVSHFGLAQAEIYKQIDADGHVTYSSSPMKGSKKLGLESPNTPSPPAASPPARTRNSDASSSSFPRVDNETQRNRDGTRRKILEDELATEGKLLSESRQNLKDGEKNPEMTPMKIKDLQGQVSLHEKNVDALKSELANLK